MILRTALACAVGAIGATASTCNTTLIASSSKPLSGIADLGGIHVHCPAATKALHSFRLRHRTSHYEFEYTCCHSDWIIANTCSQQETTTQHLQVEGENWADQLNKHSPDCSAKDGKKRVMTDWSFEYNTSANASTYHYKCCELTAASKCEKHETSALAAGKIKSLDA
jgi:hypothetical protein